MFVASLLTRLKDRDVVVVSPDAGGIKRADRFRQLLSQVLGVQAGSAFAEKYRSEGIVSGNLLVGDVRGKDAVIVDDLIGTGTTLVRTARACREHGAARVLAVATHGMFTGDANKVLAEPLLEEIVITDTVPPFRLTNDAVRDKLTVLGSSALFAQAIRRLHEGGSLTALAEA
jgi:ribose-phosphate pyrophosphokinase